MKCLEYKGYIGSVEYDLDDNVLYGKLLHIRDLVTYEGATPKELRSSFESAIDDYLKDCIEAGEAADVPFKGSFNVRVKPELHRDLALVARQKECSLNEYVGFVLSEHRTVVFDRRDAGADQWIKVVPASQTAAGRSAWVLTVGKDSAPFRGDVTSVSHDPWPASYQPIKRTRRALQ